MKGRVWIHGPGAVFVGDRVVLDGRTAPIELHAGEGATIVIEEDARVEGGASIESSRAVTVGARARVGWFCKILDNHFHRVGDLSARPPSLPVIVEEDACLCARSTLLPGAHVGRAARVGPGAVVSRRIPDRATVEGLPAVVKKG